MACRAGRDAFTRTAAIYAARRPPRGAGNAALRSAVADARGSKAVFRSAGVRLCTPAAAGLKNKRIAVKRRARLCRKAQELGLALFQALPAGGKSGPRRAAGRLLSNVRRRKPAARRLRRSRTAGIPLCGAGGNDRGG